jgi:hypothetical protein
MNHNIIVSSVDLVGPGAFLAANPANFAGEVAISGCSLNGVPVTSADIQDVPAEALRILD